MMKKNKPIIHGVVGDIFSKCGGSVIYEIFEVRDRHDIIKYRLYLGTVYTGTFNSLSDAVNQAYVLA